eukprot:gene25770-biopygen10545
MTPGTPAKKRGIAPKPYPWDPRQRGRLHWPVKLWRAKGLWRAGPVPARLWRDWSPICPEMCWNSLARHKRPLAGPDEITLLGDPGGSSKGSCGAGQAPKLPAHARRRCRVSHPRRGRGDGAEGVAAGALGNASRRAEYRDQAARNTQSHAAHPGALFPELFPEPRCASGCAIPRAAMRIRVRDFQSHDAHPHAVSRAMMRIWIHNSQSHDVHPRARFPEPQCTS